ncbi:MAG: hypothetical protein HC838_13895 [Spirulinaceae cyanobacterium RM2_2_10]|nr:hypothetical protein [Spirulinaceae cyanobacterium SM2_1_0]NJO20906.1 hypothetical protein [Spirulinaceae cyanobacterium RM2_2_10]
MKIRPIWFWLMPLVVGGAVMTPPSTAVALTQAIARELSYQLYINPRFGYAVLYPPTVLEPQPPPANGDGRRFVAVSGDIVMTVFGAHNFNQLDLNAL